MARRVIDGNQLHDRGDARPRRRAARPPVYYAPARYTDLYWVSSPDARHSRNLGARPEVRIVIFDPSAPVGQGQAVYLSATAREIGEHEHELEAACGEAFRPTAGARGFAPDELRGAAPLRLYVAHVGSCEVHVPGSHPVHGRGVDTRQAADPNA